MNRKNIVIISLAFLVLIVLIFWKMKDLPGGVISRWNILTARPVFNGFTTDRSGVYFRGGKLKGIDPNSFVFLWGGDQRNYIKDKNAVYYFDFVNRNRDTSKDSPFVPPPSDEIKSDYSDVSNLMELYGRKLEGIDPATVEIVYLEPYQQNVSYLKDKQAVYFNHSAIEGSDPATFYVIKQNLGYSYDKNHVYAGMRRIDDADPISFGFVNGSHRWAKDKNSVFFLGNKRGDFDAKTFQILGGDSYDDDYIKDKNHVVYNGRVLDIVDPSSYELFTDPEYAKDKYAVYFERKQILNADVPTFQVLLYRTYAEDVSSYAKDQNWAYFNGKIISSADVATFQVLENGSVEDRYATYSYDGKRTEK